MYTCLYVTTQKCQKQFKIDTIWMFKTLHATSSTTIKCSRKRMAREREGWENILRAFFTQKTQFPIFPFRVTKKIIFSSSSLSSSPPLNWLLLLNFPFLSQKDNRIEWCLSFSFEFSFQQPYTTRVIYLFDERVRREWGEGKIEKIFKFFWGKTKTNGK